MIFPPTIFKAAHYLRELSDKQTGIEYFEVFIRYIFGARADLTKKDMNDIVKKTKDTFLEGSEVIMTLAEQLRAEGMEKGRAEGIEKGKLDIAKNMIKSNISIEQIKVLTGLPETKIKQLVQELKA